MKMKFDRQFWVRCAAIVVVLLFGMLMFFIGKQHTILLDNKTVTVNGQEIRALQLVEVQVNKLESLELAARDRDKVDVTRQSHKITITYTDSNWNEISFTRKFKVPLMEEMVIISIPTLVSDPEADQSLWLEKYELPAYAIQASPEEEVVITDDLAGLISL